MTMCPSELLTLGGRGDDRAITWHGDTVTYGELESMLSACPTSGVTDISDMTLPWAAAHLFGAAQTGAAVTIHGRGITPPAIGALPADAWLVAYTSGSTRMPRAIYRTAASWAASVNPLAMVTGLRADDRVLVTGALAGTMHLHTVVHTLAIGAQITDVRGEATAAHCAPGGLGTLLDALPAHSPMSTVVVAGASLPDSLGRRALDRGWAVTEYYGAAELSFVAARRLPDRLLRPFPGVDVTVDIRGQLSVRSPFLAAGYGESNGEQDMTTFSPLPVNADGFATVGDIVRVQGGTVTRGFTVRGRGEAGVNTGGHTVMVEDVEAAALTIAGVRAAAAFGVPHRRLGETLALALELDGATDLSAVKARVRALLPGPARPHHFVVFDRLPTTASGKIARGSLQL